MGILSRIVPLLQHNNVKLLTRAVGVRRRLQRSPHAVLLITRAFPQVVHNMSSDSSSIASIRHEQALPMLIHLLKVITYTQLAAASSFLRRVSSRVEQAPQLAICGSAAGTLQNMSREHLSCDIIRRAATCASLHILPCRAFHFALFVSPSIESIQCSSRPPPDAVALSL